MEQYLGACRVCLKSIKDRQIPVLDAMESQRLNEFKMSFEQITGYNLRIDEPQNCCDMCLHELNVCFIFLKKCKETQLILKDLRKLKDGDVRKHEEDLLLDLPDFPLDIAVKEEWSDYDDSRIEISFADNIDEEKPRLNVTEENSQKKKPKKTKNKSLLELKPKKVRKKKIKLENSSDIKPGDDTEKVICPYCASLVKYSYLKHHIKYVHTEPRNGYSCDICKVKLSSKKSVSRHMSQVHLKRQKFICKICNTEFSSEPLKRAHLVQIHNVVPPKACPYCEYKAFTKGHMDRHIRRHRGDRRFKCTTCDYAFVTLLQLQTHEATHSDVRNFVCDNCGKRFKTKKNLYAHKKVHVPHEYECLVCGRAFLTNQMMRNHVTKTHPDFELPPLGTVLNKEAVKRMQTTQTLIVRKVPLNLELSDINL